MNITDKGLENICKIATLESLQLDGNPEVTDEGYSHLPKLQRLGMLSLCTGVITNYLIQTLVQMPSLTKLYFNGNSLTDTQLRALGKSKTLTELHLENNNLMSVAGLKYILEMPQIRAVNLRGVRWLKDDDLKAFKLVDHKFHVGLEDTKVTDAGMKLIAQSNVASIDITRTTVTDIGLLDLAKAEHLKSIRINIGGSITPGAIKKFAQLCPDVGINKEMTATNLL
jgi:Leucine-rich repeat (LRR) protein